MQAGERRIMPAPAPPPPQQDFHSARTILRPPPHPLDGQWYLHADGQTYGPYSGHQMKDYAQDGRIVPTSIVVAVGGERWVAAAEDPRLAGIFRDLAKPAPPRVTAEAAATIVQATKPIIPAPVVTQGPLVTQAPPVTQAPVVAQALPAAAPESSIEKSPGIALLLSLVICGGGQLYNGRIAKGVLMLLGWMALFWLLRLGCWIVWIWSMIDAYQGAKAINTDMARSGRAGPAP